MSVNAARADTARPILKPREFERALERERSLADRGTRQFSLLVIGIRDGHRRELARLARPLRERLRSTDLVGELDDNRLAVLLTDTEAAGAGIVVAWVERTVVELDIAIDATLYVYPSVDETGPGAASREPAPRATRPVPNQRVRARAADAPAIAAPWPVEDLWMHLSVAMPLWKRALDIGLTAVALIALSPLFLIVAIAIRLDSAGPVFFGQSRAGRGARPFTLYKFRSMTVGAEAQQAALESRNEQDGPIFKIRDDPRITPIGRLLRCSSLDELPQLWNILKGDITLVGPRSPTFREVSQYQRWQRRRLSVMGGMTCIWQVSGRSQVAFQDWMRMDMRYIARGNAWLDLALLFRTLPAVISRRGAY